MDREIFYSKARKTYFHDTESPNEKWRWKRKIEDLIKPIFFHKFPSKKDLSQSFRSIFQQKNSSFFNDCEEEYNTEDVTFIKNYFEEIINQNNLFQKIYDVNDAINNLDRMTNWKTLVRKRYKNSHCLCCYRKEKLICHHIKGTLEIIKDNMITTLEEAHNCNLLWDIDNGILLCTTCHRQAHANSPDLYLYYSHRDEVTKGRYMASRTMIERGRRLNEIQHVHDTLDTLDDEDTNTFIVANMPKWDNIRENFTALIIETDELIKMNEEIISININL